ncbi:hypothetical protein [Clostridium sp. AM54-37XD]|uniref:hypothetical protein n=1 Tax=Clostridium sp. AM54-37XD TaxID=2293038 RepID=UPI00267F6CFD
MKKTFKKLLALTLTGVLVAGAFQAAARKKIKTAKQIQRQLRLQHLQHHMLRFLSMQRQH